MKLTNSVFVLDNEGRSAFIESFQKVLNADLSVSKAMNLLAMSSQLDLRLARYTKVRLSIFKKYGKALEQEGSYTIEGASQENLQSFVDDTNELNAMEFELEGEVIDLTGEQITLKAIDLIRLKPILSALPEIKLPDEVVEDTKY